MPIINVDGYYEAYIDGKFICSGDNKKECEKDLDEYLESLEK